LRAGEAALLRAIRLRALGTDPLAFGSTLEHESAKGDDFWVERTRRHATSDDHATFVALRGGAFVGLMATVREERDRAVFGLFSVWVAPEARRIGVGAGLLGEVERWIRVGGGAAIELLVADAAPDAKRLYERAGFVSDGRTEPSPHPGVMEHGMTKRLA
jgi:ribosomal protein S18 acetylase RimI-like enzyme